VPGVSGVALAITDLEVRYGTHRVLHAVSADLRWGELTALVGPNGAGKTTLLRAVAGLVPYVGSVRPGTRRCGGSARIAYIPQRLGFDPAFPITAGRLVATGRRATVGPWRRPGAAGRAAAADALARVGLPGVQRRPVGELSGGELQRVVLARALVQDADVLLLDEPLSGVDAPARATLLGLLGELCAQGRTVLVATHDLHLARTRFDRCLGVNGTLLVDGPAADAVGPAALEAIFSAPPVGAL
jgi:ABC-type Mn2+/Zn2+ transport system ATPase subunit